MWSSFGISLCFALALPLVFLFLRTGDMLRRLLWFVVGFLLAVVFLPRSFASTATQSYQASYSVDTAHGSVIVQGASAAQAYASGTAAQSYVGSTSLSSTYNEPVLTVYSQGSFTWNASKQSGSQQFGCSFGSPVSYNGQCFVEDVNYSGCPNGGSYSTTTYPGWCIVNGQPPPASNGVTVQLCQTFAQTVQGQLVKRFYSDSIPNELPMSSLPPVGASSTFDPGNVSGSDPYSGCGLIESGPRTTVVVDGHSEVMVSYKATGLPSTASLGSGGTPSSAESVGVTACDGANFCLNGSEILAQPGTSDMDSQATINGQAISVPSSIPDNTCVSLSSGGAFCASDAVQPNNGASPPSPATPDDQVVTTGPGGSTVTDNYYSSTTVAMSSNYGNGQPSTSTGTSTTTTCTNSGGTQTCTSATTATTAKSATTYASPVFPAGTSVNASEAGAASAIQNSPLVQAAAGAIAQSVPGGSCPDWSFHSSLLNTSFDFSSGPAGICTLANNYGPTLTLVFAAMWVVLGAIIILSA